MTIYQSTEYYIVRDSKFLNVATLLPDSAVHDVLDELEDLSDPGPGDEDYARVYWAVIGKKDFQTFIEPRLEDALAALAGDTGHDSVTLVQWNSPDSTLYYLLKGRNMVELEDALGPTESDEFREVALELDRFFESQQDGGNPCYVRGVHLTRDDLLEDEGHSDELRAMLRKELPDGNDASLRVYQWTD